MVESNARIARETIREAKLLALLNSATLSDLEGIVIEAQNQSDALNQTALTKSQTISDAVNASLALIATDHNSLIMVNFTTTSITTSSNTDYTNVLTLPLQAIPTIIDCEIIANASAITTGVQYWSNVTGSPTVKQFIEYYDGVNSIDGVWSEVANFNHLATSSSGIQLHITHLKIYSDQTTSGTFTLSFRSEVGGSLVSIRTPSICEKKEY